MKQLTDTPAERLHYSCREVTLVLQRGYTTPAERLHYSCREVTQLLQSDYTTPAE